MKNNSHSVQDKELIFLLHERITPTTSHLGNTKRRHEYE